MKKTFLYLSLVLLVAVFFSSCGTVRGSGDGQGVIKRTLDQITSETEVGLELTDQTIEYTIDISTADGRLILNKMSEEEAKEYITSAALIKYNCDVIFRPKYNILKKGKQILRITMGGRPANYKNTPKDYDYVPEQNRQRVDINVNRWRIINFGSIIQQQTYFVDGEVYKTDSVAYGTEIVPEAEPSKEGYIFSGWSGYPEDLMMPAADVTIVGSFEVDGIQRVAAGAGTDTVYDLLGRKVQTQRKGEIYLQNGKKIMIRWSKTSETLF